MEHGETCNTALRLGLGVGDHVPKPKRKNSIKSAVHLDLSFTLCPREETIEIDHDKGERPCYKSSGDHIKSCDSIDRHDNNGKKKLRLTKEQLGLLEDSFKHRTTLNPAQKRALAEQLKLKPRQVEVWFQNRRARNKLKQTEVDCEFLKKWCETLKDENGRLQKELQELRTSLEMGKLHLYLDGAKHAILATCASCEKIAEKGRQ